MKPSMNCAIRAALLAVCCALAGGSALAATNRNLEESVAAGKSHELAEVFALGDDIVARRRFACTHRQDVEKFPASEI